MLVWCKVKYDISGSRILIMSRGEDMACRQSKTSGTIQNLKADGVIFFIVPYAGLIAVALCADFF